MKWKTKKSIAIAKRALMEEHVKKDRHELQDNKKSRMEILNSIAPAVQRKTQRAAGTAKAAAKKAKCGVKAKTKLGALKLASLAVKKAKAKGGKLCPF